MQRSQAPAGRVPTVGSPQIFRGSVDPWVAPCHVGIFAQQEGLAI